MNRVVGASAVDVSNDVANQASTRSSHLVDGQLDGVAAPGKRSWGEYFQEKGREIGMGAALAASAAGLSGFGEKQAQGGIVMHAETPPEYYEQVGNQFAGVFTGNSGGTIGLKFVYDRPGVGQVTRLVPGGLSTENTIFAAGHSLSNILQFNPTLTVFLGNDANNPLKTSAVTNIQFHPDYLANGFNGATAPDIFKATLVNPFEGSLPMTFANAIPDAGTTARWAGFGFQATPGGVQLGQSGKLTGGELVLSSIDPINADPSLVNVARTSQTVFGHYNPYFSDSGSRLVDITTFQTFGMVLSGGFDTDSGYSEYLDLTTGSAANNFLTTTSVPEPSSLALFGIAGAALALRRSFVRRKLLSS